MKLRDRISGAMVTHAPETVILGQWQLELEPGEGAARLNGVPVEHGAVLVPGPTGHWIFEGTGQSFTQRGRFHVDPLPGRQDMQAVLQLGEELEEWSRLGKGWSEWVSKSPLAPGLDAAIEPHPLEGEIEKELPHLVAVCRNPRTHIRIDAERVPVSRARRLDPRAPIWLSVHTEDWEHRRIAGIQPKRVLAQVREEEWDLYENRITARLIDQLLAWLRRRMGDLRRLRDDIFVRIEEPGAPSSGNWRRMERMYKLWGESWNASYGRERVERLLEYLDGLLYRLLGLLDSPLYRNIPRRAHVPAALRMTNLFAHDDHYRGVARLWKTWAHYVVPRPPSPEELYRRYQKLQRSFDLWSMLLTVRACHQLGMEPQDSDWDAPIRRGGVIRMSDGHRIRWDDTGVIHLERDAESVVRIVPVLQSLGQGNELAQAEALVKPLVHAAAGQREWTLILHLANPGSGAMDKLAGVDVPPAPGLLGAIDFIRVSPLTLDSVERVARAIRWATLAPRMLAYPPEVASVPAVLEHSVKRWLTKRSTGQWSLQRFPDAAERAALRDALTQAQHEKNELSRAHDEIKEELKRVRGNDVRRTSELNQQKSLHLQKLDTAKRLAGEMEHFSKSVERAVYLLQMLSRCPVCREQGELIARQNECFLATCSRCEIRWELRCEEPQTGVRIPVLLPDESLKPEPLDAPAQWVDRILGCEVLAIPFIEGGSMRFRPPRTIPAMLGCAQGQARTP